MVLMACHHQATMHKPVAASSSILAYVVKVNSMKYMTAILLVMSLAACGEQSTSETASEESSSV